MSETTINTIACSNQATDRSVVTLLNLLAPGFAHERTPKTKTEKKNRHNNRLQTITQKLTSPFTLKQK
jgi:hypothetical protein